MRRKLLALAALALAGTLLFSSAAAPTDDQIHENVTLAPSDGPNGAYAVVEDGELALRFDAANPNVKGDGVNAGTVTPFHDVFTITYTGDRRARVWLTTGIEDIRFYRGDDPDDGLGSRETAAVLEPDETVRVGVLIDATDGTVAAESDQFTVHAEVHDGTPTATESGGDGSSGFQFGGDGSNGDTQRTTETADETTVGTDTPDRETDTSDDGSDTPDTGTAVDGANGSGTGGLMPADTPTPTVGDGGGAADDPGAAGDPGSTPADGDGLPWWGILISLGVAAGLLFAAGRLYAAE